MFPRFLSRLIMALVLALAPLAVAPVAATAVPAAHHVAAMPCGGTAAAMTTACADCCVVLAEALLLTAPRAAIALAYPTRMVAMTGIDPATTHPPPRDVPV